MAECKHEIEETTCGICKPRKGAIDEPVEWSTGEIGRTFEARYRGHCGVCGRFFGSGAIIATHPGLGYIGPCCLP